MSSTQAAQRFLALRTARGQQPTVFQDRAQEAACIRELMFMEIGWFPRTAGAIFRAVLDEYGACDERRLWRNLRWLVDKGEVRRVDDGYVRANRKATRLSTTARPF